MPRLAPVMFGLRALISRNMAEPRRLGRQWVLQASPRLDRAETAHDQIVALGHSVDDVRHIVLTHLDLDHAGGIPDFPRARIHVHAREHAAAITRTIPTRPGHHIEGHFARAPNWRTWDDGGERWFGFEGEGRHREDGGCSHRR